MFTGGPDPSDGTVQTSGWISPGACAENAMREPSGDHSGSFAPSDAMRRTSDPSGRSVKRPQSSETVRPVMASRVPSGDHDGWNSDPLWGHGSSTGSVPSALMTMSL